MHHNLKRLLLVPVLAALVLGLALALLGPGVTQAGPPAAPSRQVTPTVELLKIAPETALPDHPFGYSFRITNTGATTVTGLILSDTIRADATLIGVSPLGVRVGNTAIFTLAQDLPPGEVFILPQVITVSAPAEQVVNSNYLLRGQNVLVPGAPVVTVIGPNLRISKSGPSSVLPGENIQYILNVTNVSEVTATGVVITDVIPVGANYVQGGVRVGDVVSFTVGVLPPGATVTRTLGVTATEGVLINNNYLASTSDGISSPRGNPVSTNITILQLSKSGPMVADDGDSIRYQFNVVNVGNVTATILLITDVIPAGSQFITSTRGVLVGDVISFTVSEMLGPGESLEAHEARFGFTGTSTQTITNSDYRVTGVGNAPVFAVGNPVVTVHGGDAASIGGDVPGPTKTLTLDNNAGLTVTVDLVREAVGDTETGFTLDELLSPPAGLNGFGFFRLNAYQGGSLTPTLVFSTPITITVAYANSNVAGLNENLLTLYFFDEGSNTWEAIVDNPAGPCDKYTYSPDENKFQVTICHLTDFGVGRGEILFLPIILKGS